ncbi:unnamed protein product [Cyclocybe aegerita]|uniref:protein-serine/threonine phosphatase n=1 Tax=Cyclocybe aegerita TaxID=1973307 RepID=A0A8S0VQX7_CYCAE|nr:unnamed protein product [Cyclocybe aegerita]
MSNEKDGTPSASSMDKATDAHDGFTEHREVFPMTPMEKQVALQAALEIDPGVKRFSWAAIQARNFYPILLDNESTPIYCEWSLPYWVKVLSHTLKVMGGINGMKQYQDYFHMTGVGPKTSIVFGIFTIGSLWFVAGHSYLQYDLLILSALKRYHSGLYALFIILSAHQRLTHHATPLAYLPDRFGRRFSMFFGNAVLIVGAILTANATNKGMFLGGRFLTGLGASCAGASAKSYLAEMAPAPTRGTYLGFLNSFYYVGQMTATGMMVATGRFQSEMSWRLPLYIQVVPAGINTLFVFLCPESPRWLYSVGKPDQARKILARFHSSTNDIKSPLVDLEMREIEEKIQINGADKTWWDFRPLFTTPADRYRAYMVILIGSFGQLSGNGLITYFLPILLRNAGITSQDKQLTLNFVNSVTSYIGALSGSAIIDRFGRRKILLLSTISITAILAIVSALLSSFGNSARANAGITFIYLFMVVFSFGWTPMQALYPAEVLSYQARAKGLAFLGIVSQVSTLINTFGLPVALEKIGWKVYLIFLFWDMFEVTVIYFFVAETKGLTLEEINEIFEKPNPRKYTPFTIFHNVNKGQISDFLSITIGSLVRALPSRWGKRSRLPACVAATKKHCESGANERFFYGLTEMQGWRITMEDAHAAILDLDGPEATSNTFFAVYDGHGGSTVARFAGQNVHKRLVQEESYKEANFETALKRAFLGTDEDLLANPAHTRDPSGCTAVAALITSDNKIYVANAGDSRSVVGIKGEVKPLSFDHKPTGETERARISGAGGYIEYGRVNGNLALSRALGDFEFKKNYGLPPEAQIITANPDVTCHEITEEDEFLVLACDGIWDCLSSQQVVDFVRHQVSEGKELTEIGEMMCDHCLAPDTTSGAGIGCDNMTVLIVAITHGRTKEEWYQWVTERVKTNYGYSTPSTVPQLYAQSRLLSFRARREAQEARERMHSTPSELPTFDSEDFLRRYGLTVTTLSGHGISYRPGGSITSDSGQLMFTNDDSDEDDSEEEVAGGRSFFTESLGLGRAESPDPTRGLKAQLDEYEKDIRDEILNGDVDGDEDARIKERQVSDDEAPVKSSSPTKLPNGDAKGALEPVEPLQATPLGEIPEPIKA